MWDCSHRAGVGRQTTCACLRPSFAPFAPSREPDPFPSSQPHPPVDRTGQEPCPRDSPPPIAGAMSDDEDDASDLFGSGSPPRARVRPAAPARLRRPLDRGARRPRARPPPPGHVYRRASTSGRCIISPPRCIDNSMDEAVAGHATRIEVTLEAAGNGRLTIADNGRGIPVDEHPKYPGKSALEVILTTLHSGGKFSRQGLCDVGRAARRRRLGGQRAVERHDRRGGAEQAALPPELRARPADLGADRARRRPRTGAAPRSPSPPTPRFSATEAKFKPARLYRLARSKAYLFAGVEIRWRCDPALRRRRGARPRRCSSSRAGSPIICASRSASARPRPTRPSPAGTTSPAARARSNGRSPGRSGATAMPLIIATPSRRPTAAPTSRACGRALTRGLRAFAELVGQKKAQGHPGRGRGHRRRDHALGLHPRSPVPEPDQGPADLARRGAAGRDCGARPFRPLSRRPYGARPRLARLRARADGRAAEAPRRARDQAQDRDLGAQAAPARQAHRLRQ